MITPHHNCVWKDNSSSILECKKCGFTLDRTASRHYHLCTISGEEVPYSKEDEEERRKLLQKSGSYCIHWQGPISSEGCAGCGSEVIQINGCSLYEECSDNANAGVKYCTECTSFKLIESIPGNPKAKLPIGYAACINLTHRPNRWIRFIDSVRNVSDWPCLIALKRFPAVDGKTAEDRPEWWKAGAGAWGCRCSHVRAIWEAQDTDCEMAFIFEDDAIFSPNFTNKLYAAVKELPTDWHVLYLGGQYHAGFPNAYSNNLVKPVNVGRTHAMLWSRAGLEWALHTFTDLKAWSQYPSDHIDHYIGRFISTGECKAYCVQPWISGQAEGFSDISNCEFDNRFWYFQSDTGIFQNDDGYTAEWHDRLLATSIVGLLQNEKIKTVWDFGCGEQALYALQMNRCGLLATGVDGNEKTYGIVADLTNEQQFDKRECVVSLEVGEHIPVHHCDTYLDNVCNSAEKLIILSWAIPGQGGRGHVNERPNDWVIEKMKKRGWILDSSARDLLRRRCLRSWFRQSLMVFRPNRA